MHSRTSNTTSLYRAPDGGEVDAKMNYDLAMQHRPTVISECLRSSGMGFRKAPAWSMGFADSRVFGKLVHETHLRRYKCFLMMLTVTTPEHSLTTPGNGEAEPEGTWSKHPIQAHCVSSLRNNGAVCALDASMRRWLEAVIELRRIAAQ